MNAGNIEKAIKDAVTVTMVTHDNYLALSGACAVAAAVSHAVMPEATVYSVLQAGLYGAKEGEKIGRKIARDVAGPSVVKRMEMAIDIGLGSGTPKEKMTEIGHQIGTGLHVAEAIPSAFGLFAAYDGDALDLSWEQLMWGMIQIRLQPCPAHCPELCEVQKLSRHIFCRRLRRQIIWR